MQCMYSDIVMCIVYNMCACLFVCLYAYMISIFYGDPNLHKG